MITPEDKDKILTHIISEFPDLRGNLYYENIASKVGLSENVVRAIIEHFCKLGFISILSHGMRTLITIKVSAHDFMSRGGFKVQEELIRADINKFNFESEPLLKNLESSQAKIV